MSRRSQAAAYRRDESSSSEDIAIFLSLLQASSPRREASRYCLVSAIMAASFSDAVADRRRPRPSFEEYRSSSPGGRRVNRVASSPILPPFVLQSPPLPSFRTSHANSCGEELPLLYMDGWMGKRLLLLENELQGRAIGCDGEERIISSTASPPNARHSSRLSKCRSALSVHFIPFISFHSDCSITSHQSPTRFSVNRCLSCRFLSFHVVIHVRSSKRFWSTFQFFVFLFFRCCIPTFGSPPVQLPSLWCLVGWRRSPFVGVELSIIYLCFSDVFCPFLLCFWLF